MFLCLEFEKILSSDSYLSEEKVIMNPRQLKLSDRREKVSLGVCVLLYRKANMINLLFDDVCICMCIHVYL